MSTFSICSTEGGENMYRRGHAFRCSKRLPGWLTHREHPGSGPREAVPVGPENPPPSRGNMFQWKQNRSGRRSLLLLVKSHWLTSVWKARQHDPAASSRGDQKPSLYHRKDGEALGFGDDMCCKRGECAPGRVRPGHGAVLPGPGSPWSEWHR